MASADDLDRVDLGAPSGFDGGRGRISIGFQSVFTDGSVDGDGNPGPGVRTDTRNLLLALDYQFAERWSLHVSLPYIVKRSLDDPGLHDTRRLREPRDGDFLDDGKWHGSWQDWQMGLTHHAHLGGFSVQPHAVVRWPSHDYTFFASAAPGRYLRSLRVGADVSRRIGRSNLHWSAGYSHEFVEKVLDIDLDKQHYRLSLRWDVAPEWSMDAFVNARYSNGITPAALAGKVPWSELWYQHDRLLQHNYVLGGLGASWRFSQRWAVAGSSAWPLHADSMHRVRNAWEVSLQRSF